jgi:hypothetical protein
LRYRSGISDAPQTAPHGYRSLDFIELFSSLTAAQRVPAAGIRRLHGSFYGEDCAGATDRP